MTFRSYFLAGGILSILSAIGFLAVKSFLPPLVPLFYGRPTGVEQLMPTWFLLIIPGVSIVITIINVFINISAEDELIKKNVAVGAFVLSLMTTVTLIKIILLVGFF